MITYCLVLVEIAVEVVLIVVVVIVVVVILIAVVKAVVVVAVVVEVVVVELVVLVIIIGSSCQKVHLYCVINITKVSTSFAIAINKYIFFV